MLQLSGGLKAYLVTASAYSNVFFRETSLLHGAGLPGLERNLSRLYRYTLYSAGGMLLALAATSFWWRGRWRQVVGNGRGVFLLLWFTPSFLFYVVVHMGQHGLIFTFTPPLLLLAAGLFDAAATARALPERRGGFPVGLIASGMAAGCGALTFLFAPEHPFVGTDGGAAGIKVLSAATLRNQGRDMAAEFSLLRTQFPPNQTWVISPLCRQMSYYLPEYRVLWSDAWGAPADETVVVPTSGGASDKSSTPFGTWRYGAGALAPLTRLPALSRDGAAPRYLILFGNRPRVRLQSGTTSGGPEATETIIGHTAGDQPVPIRRVLLPPGSALSWDAAGRALMVISRRPASPAPKGT